MKQPINKAAVATVLAILGMAGSVGGWAIAAHSHPEYITEREYNEIQKDLDLIIDQLFRNLTRPSPEE